MSERISLDREVAQVMMLDAMRWRFSTRYGFPVRNQCDDPAWIVYCENSPIRGSGATPNNAVDDAMMQMGVIKQPGG